MMSDVICLPESWIWDDEDTTHFGIEYFSAHHNAAGRGRGITMYYKRSKFEHVLDINEEKIQISKLVGKQLELIIVYKAPGGKAKILANHLKTIINPNKTWIVCGDFNMCFVDNNINMATTYLLQNGFKQLVNEATHIYGGHIDHIYVRIEQFTDVITELYSPYFTAKDHDALLISLDLDLSTE